MARADLTLQETTVIDVLGDYQTPITHTELLRDTQISDGELFSASLDLLKKRLIYYNKNHKMGLTEKGERHLTRER